MYPFETYEIPQNPNELEYRIENSREQKIKEYDFFISHSSKDSTHVQKLIRAENQDGKNVFCDWINDVDYLKRHLLCKATLKVLEKRMEQSKAMIFVVSENSLHSIWCKYESVSYTHLGYGKRNSRRLDYCSVWRDGEKVSVPRCIAARLPEPAGMMQQQNHAIKICAKNRCVFRKREMHRFFFLKKATK